MKGFKDFIKDILAIALIAGVCFGGYTLYKNYKVNEAKSDDSYKVLTNKDPSYDGVYTLTKLDELGNNTWDGLSMTVEKDRIIDVSYHEHICSFSDLKREVAKLENDNSINKLDIWEFSTTYGTQADKVLKDIYKVKLGKDSWGISNNEVTVDKWAYDIPDNIKLNEVNDITTPFDKLKEYDLLPAFDEKSGEVWLSKLLKNEQSEFHEGYKLIKYDTLDSTKKAKIPVNDSLEIFGY